MQDIAEKLKSFAGQAGEGLGKGLDVLKDKASQAGDYLQANPTIAAMLLAGGGSGLLGGYLTSQQKEEEGESKAQRRGRILRNALLAGAAGAGTVGLGAAGLKRLSEATPVGSVNPVQEKLTSPFARAIGGAGGAALGFSAGARKDLAAEAAQAFNSLSAAEKSKYINASPEKIILAAGKRFKYQPDKITDYVDNLRMNVQSPEFQKNLAKVFGKQRAAAILMDLNQNPNKIKQVQNVLTKVLGTSRAGRYARIGGLGGVFLPEIIGGAKDLVLAND
jgi:hypothetical protein